MKKLASALLLTVALCGIASASIIPSTPVITGPTSGVYTWTYSMSVAGDETLTTTGAVASDNPPGTFVTIYDILGFVTGSCVAPTGWSCSAQLTGVTPSSQNVTDSPSIINVTWTYTGSSTAGPVNVTGFSYESVYGLIKTGIFSAQSYNNSTVGVDQENGPVDVPNGTPEPASLGLIGGSLIGLGLLGRRLLQRAKN